MEKEKFIEAVEKMTVLEIAELVKAMEEKFGISAALPAAAHAPPSRGCTSRSPCAARRTPGPDSTSSTA